MAILEAMKRFEGLSKDVIVSPSVLPVTERLLQVLKPMQKVVPC